jgi:hypothetical protein
LTCNVELVLDSISREGKRLTTIKYKNPRMVHADFMTHRVFSRNASSSRATPVEKLVQATLEDMYVPIFRKNKAGMQPGESLSIEDQSRAEDVWIAAATKCAEAARQLAAIGVHKQWANRMLEWFGHINVVVTSTNWENYFNLRMDRTPEGWPVAQDEIELLASEIKRVMDESKPTLLLPGEWHLPFVEKGRDLDILSSYVRENGHDGKSEWIDYLIKLSVARCARVSYLTSEGKVPSVPDDLKLYDRLVGAHPIHASPAEHQATPDLWVDFKHERRLQSGSVKIVWGGWERPELHGNFDGFIQYRKFLPGESGKTEKEAIA